MFTLFGQNAWKIARREILAKTGAIFLLGRGWAFPKGVMNRDSLFRIVKTAKLLLVLGVAAHRYSHYTIS